MAINQKKFTRRVTNGAITITVIVILFLALAAPQLHLPGPSNDEMDTVVLTMQMLLGLPSDAGYSVKLGNLELPLTVQAYVGTAYTYLLLPFFAIGGINIISVRVMTLTVGAVIMIFSYLFLKDFYDDRVAKWTIALMATSPSFIFWNRIGIFPKTLALLAAIAILYCIWRWYRGRGAGYLYGAAFFCGLGINTHPIFIWPVFAYGASAVLIRRRVLFSKAKERLKWRQLIAALLFFLHARYNLARRYNARDVVLACPDRPETRLYGVHSYLR